MFRIFYSWASDFNERTNRVFIRKALRKALKELCDEPDIQLSKTEIEVVECGDFDKPTDIVDFIMDNLPESQAHVADITFIGKIDSPKGDEPSWVPNPNNMLELGVALASIGRDQTILVSNSAHGNVSELPFDIRNLNCLTYEATDQGKERKGESAKLKNKLKDSLRGIAKLYGEMTTKVADDFHKSLDEFLPFFRDFMAAYTDNQDFIEASMAIFDPQVQMEPDDDALEYLLRLFHAENLTRQREQGETSEQSDSRSWGYEFSLLLRRFQNDCERIDFRYDRLQRSRLLEAIRLTGKEAGFLESLCSRMDSRLRMEMLDAIFVDELKEFLVQLKKARLEAASCLKVT